MDLRNLEVDASKELEGVWHNIDWVTSVRVARYGNSAFQKAMQKLLESAPKHKTSREEWRESDEYDAELNTIIAETILVDWKGMLYGGVEVEYSVNKAVEFLNDPKLKDFRELILQLAMDASQYRAQDIEEVTENL